MDDFSYYQNNLTLDSLHHNYKFHLWDHRNHCHCNAFQCQDRIHLKVIVDILEIWSKLYNLLTIFTFTSVSLKSFIAYAGSNCIITNSLVWTKAILWTIKFCRMKNFMSKKLLNFSVERKIILLEQSRPCLPGSHVHSPMLVSQTPALLQSSGHFSSRI